jgi:glycerol-3-phosphate dehydrogenase (NAD(P)+)
MIAILGAGTMGCAMAIHLMRAGERVTVFATDHDAAVVRAWRDRRPHPGLGIVLDPEMPVRDLATSRHLLAEADLVAVAVSSSGLVPVLASVSGYTSPHATWVLATKGWQEDTLLTPSELAATYVGPPGRLVTLAGPALAAEVAAGLPTAFLFASRDADARRLAARTFAAPSMITVTTSDVVGAETASAYKNVAAISVGIAEGLSKRFARNGAPEVFANARAAMFAQGMIDTVRLAEARGGRAATVLGLAGTGDLYVTCVGGRNGRFGRLLGSGTTVDEALRIINSTVEGISNTRAALGLGARYSVDLRAARTVDLALHHHLAGDEAIQTMRELFTATMTTSDRSR